MYWVKEYDTKWYPICEICGKSFKKVLAHVWQKHNLLAREYKIKFWFDTNKWIMCEESTKLCSINNKKNFNLVVKNNLITEWKETRFKKWWGKKKYFSEESRLRIQNQMRNYFNNKK